MRQIKFYRKIFFIFKISLFFFLFSVFCFLFLFIYYAKDLPRPERFLEKQFVQSTRIYDRTGEVLLYEIFGEEKRILVPLEKIPEHLKQAVIAAEDGNFYHHFGIDLKAIARSILLNIERRALVFGGSTIPQQLIRSAFLTLERTPERKIREIILAIELDRRYSKEQILEWYLNQVPFGSNAYGVEAAAQTFFNKSVSEISLAEAAILAALIQGPTRLSPYGPNKDLLFLRQRYVLDRMVQLGFITQEEAELAKKEEVKFAEVLTPIKAPHFVLWIKDYLLAKYGENFLRERGMKVFTTLNWELQQWAEKVIKEGVERNKIHNAHNASLVAIDPKTGQILAMVGSANWFAEPYPPGCIPGKNCLFDPKFNVAIGTKQNPGRQPGSAFKPFVYAVAFQKGYSDQKIVIDEETNFGFWGGKEYIPQNYDGLFRGPVTLREALAQSLNIPSVKVLLNLAGLTDSVKTAQNLGITTLKPPYGPSIVLGGWEVKLLEMVSAYGVFANEGLKVPPVAILRIEDYRGNIFEENKKTPKRVLPSKVAQLITDILSDNEARAPIFGERSVLYFEDYKVAVKTGTTDNFKDAWTIGYTPSLVVGVWVGNNDNSPMLKPGVVLAAPIWRHFIEKTLVAPSK